MSRHKSKPNRRVSTKRPRQRAIVLHPVIRARAAEAANGTSPPRPPERRLDEACGLARAIDLDVVDAQIVRGARISPATLFGRGKIETLSTYIAAQDVGLLIVDFALTPVQQRNLERALKAKVVDRTALILEIFGARARTREGRLQVELAHLTYQRSRLVRSWTHLERQRGGVGFLGGPGETQIEADRRVLSEKIVRLKAKLAAVERTRGLHRHARQRVPYPIVVIVGYTNAGKSTLFNRLTASEVMAADMLFATLDPTMREIVLPSGARAILSDTVGFISDLPTELVAAFRATLEEVREADVILHVRDIADPDTAAQKDDVLGVLKDLDIDTGPEGPPIVEVLNKIDVLPDEDRALLETRSARGGEEGRPVLPVSAQTGDGIPALRECIDQLTLAGASAFNIEIDAGEGEAIAWLHRRGRVVTQRMNGKGRLSIVARLNPQDQGQFQKEFRGRGLTIKKAGLETGP